MRLDIKNAISKLNEEELKIVNKSELARRLGCNRRMVSNYIKDTVKPNKADNQSKKKPLLVDPFKDIILEKVDNYGASAMAVFKFIKKKDIKVRIGRLLTLLVNIRIMKLKKLRFDLRHH